MRYETIENLPGPAFKRLTGVKKPIFDQMLAALTQGSRSFGRPPALSHPNQLLLTLNYWREYRTLFHIAKDFGVSEATACRTVNRTEDRLLRSGRFRLPGKKALRPGNTTFQVVLVDAAESPVERPFKKSEGPLQRKEETAHSEGAIGGQS